MTWLRAIVLASMFGALALVACGSAGSGGGGPSTGPATANPALGTNQPAQSPKPSDPYSEPGY